MAINVTTVYGIIRAYNATGTHLQKKRGGYVPQIINPIMKCRIQEWIDEDAGITLKNLKAKLAEEFGISASTTTISKCISSFHYSMKRLQLQPARRNDMKSLECRQIYALKYIGFQSMFSERNIIFIDETGFNVSMRTSRGRSKKGTPAVLVVPQIRSRNISVCCAMSKYGIMYYAYQNHAFNSQNFTNFLSELIEKLKSQSTENFLFIMDNVR